MEQIDPTPLAVTVGDRKVPAVLWHSHGREAPLAKGTGVAHGAVTPT